MRRVARVTHDRRQRRTFTFFHQLISFDPISRIHDLHARNRERERERERERKREKENKNAGL